VSTTVHPTNHRRHTAAQLETEMSATVTSLKNVMGQLTTRRNAAESEYLDLIESIAAGEHIDADVIHEVLDAAKKTAEQFQADVTAKTERLRLTKVAAGYHDHERQLLAARDEQEKLKQELERVTARLSAQIRDKQAECDERTRQMAEAKAAQRELLTGYRGPLKEQQQQAERRIATVESRMTALKRDMGRLEQQLQNVTANPTKYPDGTADRTRVGIANHRKELAAMEAERDAAAAEVSRITSAMRLA
jgi:chromosome segregation ATPase